MSAKRRREDRQREMVIDKGSGQGHTNLGYRTLVGYSARGQDRRVATTALRPGRALITKTCHPTSAKPSLIGQLASVDVKQY